MVQSIQHDWQPINQSHGYPKSWPSSRRSKRPQARAGSPGLTASPNFESDLLIFKKHFYIYASGLTYAHVGKYIWSLAMIAFISEMASADQREQLFFRCRFKVEYEIWGMWGFHEMYLGLASQPVSHACMFQRIWARFRRSFFNLPMASCGDKAPWVVIKIQYFDGLRKCGLFGRM